MKKASITIVIFFLSLTTFGQDITGKWYGLLKVPGAQLPIEINVTKTENGYKSTMDSPEQKAFDIPIPSTSYENTSFKFAIPAGRIEYEGTFENNKIKANHEKEPETINKSFWKKYEYILIINDKKINIPAIFDLFILINSFEKHSQIYSNSN